MFTGATSANRRNWTYTIRELVFNKNNVFSFLFSFLLLLCFFFSGSNVICWAIKTNTLTSIIELNYNTSTSTIRYIYKLN